MITKCEKCTLFINDSCTLLNSLSIIDGRCSKFNPDDISTAQHRFYRGLILPALTEALGETNNQYVHDFVLKPEWVYRKTGGYYFEVNDYSEIPAKHQGNARILSEYIYKESPCVKECNIYGYIPSMASFTKAETKDYFKFCETMLEEIGGQIPTESNQEYRTLRERVLK